MMKPFQIKVFSSELDQILSPEAKAVSLSSHNAEPIHIQAIKTILKDSELGLMQTPHALPLVQFGKQLRRPRRWYHPCSGKHAAILRGCQIKGWSRVGYLWPHHKFHQSYLDIVRETLGSNWNPKVTAKDGCRLPTVSNTVNELATLFSALARKSDEDWMWQSMIDFPDMIGGFNRLDSTILKSCDGQVIAKEGADGLLGLAIKHKDYPDGLGIVIKIAHGWDSTATWHVARWALGVLGFKLRNPYKLERQKAFIVKEIIPENLRGNMQDIEAWDSWDTDEDRWDFDFDQYSHQDKYSSHPSAHNNCRHD
jgi:L-asparaginase II